MEGDARSWQHLVLLLPLLWERLCIPAELVSSAAAGQQPSCWPTAADHTSGCDLPTPQTFLPLMIGYFALNVPSGLALYYFSNSVLTTLVQVG